MTATSVTPPLFSCLALSPAGKVPVFGRNQHHEYGGKKEWSHGWYCDESALTAATISGGPEFSAHHWNRKMQLLNPNGKLDAPDGWQWGEVEVSAEGFGGRQVAGRREFVGYWTAHPNIYEGGCMIDRPRYLHDLKLLLLNRGVVDLPIPKFKSHGSHAFCTEVSCTDGTRWPLLNLRATNYTWLTRFTDAVIHLVAQ